MLLNNSKKNGKKFILSDSDPEILENRFKKI